MTSADGTGEQGSISSRCKLVGRGKSAGEVAPSVKCLLHKQESLSLIPRTHINKSGEVAHSCNHTARKASRQLLRIASQLQASKSHCLKT